MTLAEHADDEGVEAAIAVAERWRNTLEELAECANERQQAAISCCPYVAHPILLDASLHRNAGPANDPARRQAAALTPMRLVARVTRRGLGRRRPRLAATR